MPHVTTRFVGNLGVRGSITCQGCALSAQTSAVARNQLGSSRLPARMPRKSGRPELDAKSGEPQSPQNARRATFPLSAALSKTFGSPRVIRKAERLTTAVGE
jgi:hypothetical protein